ncbi:MAG: hypothetical protein LKI53_02755 [Bacteroidales bacterium]|jgi:hypothetical protein|nr:hypothetical protein [Bacteroidales bacterium]
MKKIYTTILFIFLILPFAKAQNNRMISMQISFNQIEVGLSHRISNKRLWAEIYAGIANQDINRSFDDFTSRMGISYIFLQKNRNRISLHGGLGIYLTNNHYYSVTVPFINTGIRYSRLIGKTKRHVLFVSTGYRYGKRDYRQEYKSNTAIFSTIGTFRVAPLYFSIGYGFKF